MFMRKSDTIDATAAETARLADVLRLPPNNALKLVIRNHRSLRAEARTIADRKREIEAQYREMGGAERLEAIERLEADLGDANKKVRAAAADLEKMRAAASEAARAKLEAAVADYKAALHRRIDEVEALLAVAQQLDNLATLEGLTLHRIFGTSHACLDQIAALRREVAGR